jgi:hypothetical protein
MTVSLDDIYDGIRDRVIDAVDVMLDTIAYDDVTTAEFIALAEMLRPIYERISGGPGSPITRGPDLHVVPRVRAG